MTPKQQKAKCRNFAKRRTSAMKATCTVFLQADYLTVAEKAKLAIVRNFINELLTDWQKQSRRMGMQTGK